MSKTFKNSIPFPEVPKAGPDIAVSNHGTVFLFRPMTDAAKEHLETHCPDATWFGGALVVEHRYAGELTENLINDGFDLQ